MRTDCVRTVHNLQTVKQILAIVKSTLTVGNKHFQSTIFSVWCLYSAFLHLFCLRLTSCFASYYHDVTIDSIHLINTSYIKLPNIYIYIRKMTFSIIKQIAHVVEGNIKIFTPRKTIVNLGLRLGWKWLSGVKNFNIALKYMRYLYYYCTDHKFYYYVWTTPILFLFRLT
jgi:hypothetical protein